MRSRRSGGSSPPHCFVGKDDWRCRACRGSRPRRPGRRLGTVAGVGSARQTRCLARGGGQARAIDRYRRDERLAHKVALLGGGLQPDQGFEAEVAEGIDDDIGDDLLRWCSPPVTRRYRRRLGRFDPPPPRRLDHREIAHAYLVPPATIAQRIVRASGRWRGRRSLRGPVGRRAPDRLGSVLEVIYAIFNEGYSATAGEHWTRPTLCEEALRLGRILATLMPSEPEVHGLVALMEIRRRDSCPVGTWRETGPLVRPEPCPMGPTPHQPGSRGPGKSEALSNSRGLTPSRRRSPLVTPVP